MVFCGECPERGLPHFEVELMKEVVLWIDRSNQSCCKEMNVGDV